MFVFNFLKRYKLFNNFIVSEDQNLQRILFLLLISFFWIKLGLFLTSSFQKVTLMKEDLKSFSLYTYIYTYRLVLNDREILIKD